MISPPGDHNFIWSDEHQLYVNPRSGVWFDPDQGRYSDPYTNAWLPREPTAEELNGSARHSHRVEVVEAPAASTTTPRRDVSGSGLLNRAARVHRHQLYWVKALRVLWWVLLLPVALFCWACTRSSQQARAVVFAAAAVAILAYGVTLASTDRIIDSVTPEDSPGEARGVLVVEPAPATQPPPTTTAVVPVTAPVVEVLGEVAYYSVGSRQATLLSIGENAAYHPELLMLLSDLEELVGEPAPERPAYDGSMAATADLDQNCRTTTHEVLENQAVEVTRSLDGCKIVGGQWFDPFSGRDFDGVENVQVTPVVAFADAWDSGAWRLSDADRELFANSMANLSVMGVHEATAKGDLGPAGYAPTNVGQRCSYLAQYGVVKASWGLSITATDFAALSTGLTQCGDLRRGTFETIGVESEVIQPAAGSSDAPDCHPNYTPCIPYGPGDFLDCDQIDQNNVVILGLDPYNLDDDGDGVGCGG